MPALLSDIASNEVVDGKGKIEQEGAEALRRMVIVSGVPPRDL